MNKAQFNLKKAIQATVKLIELKAKFDKTDLDKFYNKAKKNEREEN